MIVVVDGCVVVIDVRIVRGHRSRLYGMIEIWEHNRSSTEAICAYRFSSKDCVAVYFIYMWYCVLKYF